MADAADTGSTDSAAYAEAAAYYSAWREGIAKSAATRRAEREAGLAYARAWKERGGAEREWREYLRAHEYRPQVEGQG